MWTEYKSDQYQRSKSRKFGFIKRMDAKQIAKHICEGRMKRMKKKKRKD